MAVVNIPKLDRAGEGDHWNTPGPWWTLLTGAPKGNSATVRCPDCGTRQTLTRHDIAADGTVKPSLLCATKSCNWHVMAKLESWTP